MNLGENPEHMRSVVLVVAFLCSAVSPAVAAPVLTFSVSQMYHGEIVQVRGTGFTPNGQVTSHLVRPDGTEYPEMPLKAETVYRAIRAKMGKPLEDE